LPLLRKSEAGVENDDRDDRHPQRRQSCGERQGSSDPEEEREWMYYLPGELPWPAAATLSRQLVGAVGDKASLGLAAREPLGMRPEVTQEEVDRLARIANADIGRLGRCGCAHEPDDADIGTCRASGNTMIRREKSTEPPR
jgi:hypothetical protein